MEGGQCASISAVFLHLVHPVPAIGFMAGDNSDSYSFDPNLLIYPAMA